MSEDYYDEGLRVIKEDISEITGLSMEQIESVYTELVNIGLIDYDIEKDIIWGILNEEE